MNKNIIVSMTSWPKRINNVAKVIYSILKNTVQPNKIICNLSTEEFPNKEKDLPEVLLLLSETTCFEINWVKENTKVFKKFIPTLEKYGTNFYLFTIDDDELYDNTYIETGMKALEYHKAVVIAKRNPNATNIWGGMFCCDASLFDKSYWENLSKELINESMNDPYTDRYLTFKNIKIHNVLEQHTKVFNPVFPNRGGIAYSKEKRKKVVSIVEKLFETKLYN